MLKILNFALAAFVGLVGVASGRTGEVQERRSTYSKLAGAKIIANRKLSGTGEGTEKTTLGNKRPEGTANGLGATIYVSNFFYGGVSAVNVNTGKITQVVPDKEFLERGGIGLSFLKDEGVIFVGGGGPKGLHSNAEVYVYHVETGEEIVACGPLEPGLFMNEVTIAHGKAYITDSGKAKLMVMDVDAALNGKCDISSIDLPEAFEVGDGDDWGANGVVPYGDGLIIVHEGDGSAFFLDLTNNNAVTQIVEDGEVATADGVLIHRKKMYVTQNFENQISVFSLSGGRNGHPVVAEKEGVLTSPLYREPATSAIHGGRIYSVNARFGDLEYPHPGEDTEDFDQYFDMVSVRNVFDPNICEA